MDIRRRIRKGLIETFIIDWPVLSLLGLLFGTLAPGAAWARSRAFLGGLASALVFTAVALISYAIAPDWMWMYFIKPSDASWAVPLIALGYVFVFAISFAAAVTVRRASPLLVWAAVAWCGVMELAVVVLTWDRYHLVGTAAQWNAGAANELFSTSPQGPARSISLLVPLFVVAAAIALFVAWRGRAAAADR